jgi:hypothetical protein
MAEDTDLLPWILGGLLAATVAIAITVGASNGTAPNGTAPNKSHAALQTAPLQTAALGLPGAEATPRATAALSQATVALSQATVALPQAPAIAPTAAPNLSAAQIQTSAPPTQPTSQIWQCTINGQKTFSDAPCGDKSSLRELGPINRMDPSPVFSHAPPYGREASYQSEYSYPGEQADSNAAEQQLAGNSYPVFVGIPIHEHRRPEHAHRPHEHNRGPQPRRN